MEGFVRYSPKNTIRLSSLGKEWQVDHEFESTATLDSLQIRMDAFTKAEVQLKKELEA